LNTTCLQDNVEFVVNAPYPEVISWLGKSSVGINTMVDEHFGINVVEFMVSVAASSCEAEWILTSKYGDVRQRDSFRLSTRQQALCWTLLFLSTVNGQVSSATNSTR
jgi:hypothetical protein